MIPPAEPTSGNSSAMPSCREVSDALSNYLEELLSDGDRLKLEEHLAACPLCLVYLEQFREVYQLTGEAVHQDLPADFTQVMGKVIARWKADLAQEE